MHNAQIEHNYNVSFPAQRNENCYLHLLVYLNKYVIFITFISMSLPAVCTTYYSMISIMIIRFLEVVRFSLETQKMKVNFQPVIESFHNNSLPCVVIVFQTKLPED